MNFNVNIAACFLMAAVLFCFEPPLAQETQDHWLIGRWEGNISGYIGRSSPLRTLRVTEVSPDGTAEGTWYVTGQQALTASIRVKGAEVKIATAGNSAVELTRDKNDSLVGKYISTNGETLPIKLTKTESPDRAGEK